MHDDTRSRQGSGIISTNGREIEIPLLVDIADQKAEFVDMRGQHHARVPVRIERCDNVAVYIRAYLVSIHLHFFAHHLLRPLLKTRRAGAGNQSLQKSILSLVCHNHPSKWARATLSNFKKPSRLSF